MTVVWILFVCSVILLPATALLALRWAVRNGEFNDLNRTALSIFDEDEPVGRQTDRFPGPSPADSQFREAARPGARPLPPS